MNRKIIFLLTTIVLIGFALTTEDESMDVQATHSASAQIIAGTTGDTTAKTASEPSQ